MEDIRENLMNTIAVTIHNEFGIDAVDVMPHLFMCMDGYEFRKTSTEISVNDMNNNELLQQFLTAKIIKGCSARTIEYYEMMLKRILQKINKNMLNITTDDIREYLLKRQFVEKTTLSQCKRERQVLSAIYGYLAREGYVRINPVARVEYIKAERKIHEAFTDEEIEKIRFSAKTTMEKMTIELLLSTGCRLQEAAGIRIDEIEGDEILIHGKGDKDRTVYINAKTKIALETYLADRKDENPYLFPEKAAEYVRITRSAEWYKNKKNVDRERHRKKGSIYNLVRDIGEKAQIEHVHPHRFRRTCATMALRRGMPIEQVSKMLGHTSIETTKLYITIEQEELKASHKKFVY